MSPIDQLLSRALLLKRPQVPADIVPYEDSTFPLDGLDDVLWPHDEPAPRSFPEEDTDPDPVVNTAAANLLTLCRTFVANTAATSLSELVTETLPAPGGARVVGCILLLAQDETSARSWWQYAAGAGDDAAGYCLYLHHLSRGDTDTAEWWLQQTGIDPRPAMHTVLLPDDEGLPIASIRTDPGITTVLRVLNRLTGPGAPWRRTEVVAAVADYVLSAVAVGGAVHPEAEISLPSNFAEDIEIILAAATAIDAKRCPGPTTPPRVLIGHWLNS